MDKAGKIADRLPHFYKHWDNSTAISSIVSAIGKNMGEAEKDFIAIMRSHWVDTASGNDLDRLGTLFSIKRKASETDESFRGRLKAAAISYNGGGTPGAIRTMMRVAMGLPADYPVTIVENPLVQLKKTWKVRANTEWVVNPRNTRDVEPGVTVEVETENVKIADPTITNLDTGQTVTYNGTLARGDVLKMAGDRATLNGKDVSGMLAGRVPLLPRRKTRWKYSEAVGSNVGVFDTATFDRSVFAVDIASAVTLEWPANQPATFEVVVERGQLERAGVTETHLQEILNMAKGCGVKAGIRLAEGPGEPAGGNESG
jgi:hypothetical protein